MKVPASKKSQDRRTPEDLQYGGGATTASAIGDDVNFQVIRLMNRLVL